jgi:hypothetical protein
MNTSSPAVNVDELIAEFDAVLGRFAEARKTSRKASNKEVLELARQLLPVPGGLEALYSRVPELEAGGLFAGSDWDKPAILQPDLAMNSLRQGRAATTVIEALSELRLLAVANGDYFHPGVSAEWARNFLTQVMALNLDLLSGHLSEADRERPKALGTSVQMLYQYLLAHLGYESILESLVDEVYRLIAQRPIETDSIKKMIVQIAECLVDLEIEMADMDRAERLVRALFGPTAACQDEPELEVYARRLTKMGRGKLLEEAAGFVEAMDETGLVSPYHPVFVRHLRGQWNDLIPSALGLSNTGVDALLCYQELVYTLIDEAVFPETSQALYGLALLLEDGVLYSKPVAPGLWRQMELTLSEDNSDNLAAIFGDSHPPRVHLLAGILSILGQPLGVGQGNNPTCQSARALSMWAYNDPDYLLQLVAWASRDDEIIMRFEGGQVSSRGLEPGLAEEAPIDVDAVSAVLVPHLDRIYMEMGRLCEDRDDDPHRWINPEFHGWWVGHGFRIAVDIESGNLVEYERFIRDFYACYNPFYNGHVPVIHPQPAGIAATDSAGRFIGWHAITILRVALSPANEMRVYFYNPNNDSGQNWGQGIITATQGHDEEYGEASLPVAEFASRLYVFHYDPLEMGDPEKVSGEEVARVAELGKTSWAKNRQKPVRPPRKKARRSKRRR